MNSYAPTQKEMETQENLLKKAAEELKNTVNSFSVNVTDPVLYEFIKLIDFIALESKNNSDKNEIDTLIQFANSATLKLKEPDNKANNDNYDELEKRFLNMAKGKPKNYSPMMYNVVQAGICIASIVSMIALIAATVTAVVMVSAALAPSFVGSFFASATIVIAGVALYEAVNKLFTRMDEKAGSYFRSQRAYKEFNDKVNNSFGNENVSLFSSSRKTEKNKENNNNNQVIPKP